MGRVIGIILAFLVSTVIATHSLAKLTKQDLERKTVLTEEAAFLSQVDTVSLYLSSDKVVLAPRLAPAGVVEVEATVLSPDMLADRDRLEGFLSRQIRTFNDVLKERLPIFAPELAKKFDANTDIVFIINAGQRRAPLGKWRAGSFVWEKTAPLATIAAAPSAVSAEASVNEARAESIGRKGCNCPARK